MKRLFLVWSALLLAGSSLQAQCGSYSCGSYASTPSYSYQKTYTPYQEVVYQRFLAVIPLIDLPTYSAVSLPGVQVAPQATTGAPFARGAVGVGGASVSSTTRVASSVGLAAGAGAVAGGGGSELAQVLAALKAQDTKIDRRFAEVEERMIQMEARLPEIKKAPREKEKPREEKLPPPKGEELPKDKKVSRAQKVAASQCALCHQQGNEARGGDFVLTLANGEFRRLSNDELDSLFNMLVDRKMPKLHSKDKDLQRAIDSAGLHELDEQEFDALRVEIVRQAGLNDQNG